jgi:hypothetical protein
LGACANAREEKNLNVLNESQAVADSVSSAVPGIATDTINGITHNFIRKADLKCKVKDVLETTRQIETLINSVGGYVTVSNMNSNKEYTHSIHFKKDSLREITHYTSSSDLILRIPNYQLDSIINRITDLAIFVDFRSVHAEDVKLKLFANKLAENRYHEYKKRVQSKVDKKDDKLNRITDAEENVLDKQSMADNKRVESYDLADQVNYSTISCALYQRQKIFLTDVAAPPVVEPYEASYGEKLGNGFLNGFEILKGVLLFFANTWSIFLILIAFFFAIKKLIIYINRKSSPLPAKS